MYATDKTSRYNPDLDFWRSFGISVGGLVLLGPLGRVRGSSVWGLGGGRRLVGGCSVVVGLSHDRDRAHQLAVLQHLSSWESG